MDDTTLLALINSVSFFNDFSLDEKKTIVKLRFDVVRFSPSDLIIKEGEFEETFYILLKGDAQVIKAQKVITILKPGALFGELSWLGKKARISSVVAATEVVAFRLDLKKVQKFEPIIRDKIKDKIIVNLISRLENMNKQLTNQNRT